MANEFKVKKGLIVTGADGGTVVDIQGSQGQLFSVTDDLSGSIFAVSDISGVPILDVNSSGLSTFDGNVNLPDNKKILLGTGNDLEIYHTGSHSFIQDVGTGMLAIDTNGTDVRITKTDSEFMAKFVTDAEVQLYYNGSKKFETQNAGVKVTGSLTTTATGGGTGILMHTNSGISISSNLMQFWTGQSSGYKFYANSTGDETNELLALDASGNGTFAGNIEAGKNIYQDIGSKGGYIMRPWGADYLNTSTNTHTGAIKITLPTTIGEDDMIKFTVDIYQYVTNESLSVDVSGYIYQAPGGNTWYNCTSIVNAKKSTENYKVRYGDDGTNHCIWIGELDTVWNHPQIICRDFFGGFAVETSDYLAEWDISFESTAFEDVQTTQSDNFPLSSGGVDGAFLPLSAGASYPLTGALNILIPGDPKLILQSTSGDTSDWNYINFVGRDAVRDGYIGTDGDGDMQIYSDKNASSVELTSSGILLNGNKVGIGTTSPQANTSLDVRGNGAASDAAIKAYAYGESGTSILGNGYATSGSGINYGVMGLSTGPRSTVAGSVNVGGYFSAGNAETNYALITETGNVGIGTTSPGYKLDVDGDIRAKENIRVFGNSVSPPTYNAPTETSVNLGTYINDYAYIDLASTNAGGSWLDFSKGDGTDYAGRIRYANSSDQFQISTAGSQKMVIDSNGNVGIGTTSPASKLQVGDYMASNVLTIGGWYGGGGGTLAFKSGYVPNAAYVWDTARIKATDDGNFNGRIEFQTTASGGNAGGSPTTKMVLKANGNVGIGTTSPSEKLEVSGKVRIFDGGYPYIDLGVSTSNYFRIIHDNPNDILKIGKNGATTSSSLIVQGGTGNVGIGGVPGSRFDIQGTQGQLFSVTDDLSGDIFSVADISGVPIMNVNSDGTSYFDGNVGIGTTSPGSKLEVSSYGAAGILISKDTVAGSNSGRLFFETDTVSEGFSFLNSNGFMTIRSQAQAGVTSGNTRVTINGSGSVGIGTTNPGAKLHVESTDAAGANFILESTSAIGIPLLDLKGAHSAQLRYKDELDVIQGRIDFGDSGTFNFIDVPNNNSTLYLKTGGNVGIGTTNPLHPLSIESASSPLIKIRNTTNAGGAAIEFNDNAGSSTTQNGRIVYRHSDSQSQGGGSTFELLGENDQTLQVLNNGRIVVQKSGSATEVGYGFYDDINTGMYRAGADTLAFSTAGNNRLHIDSSGNVGIGTTSPGSKLEVEGDTANALLTLRSTSGGTNDAFMRFFDEGGGGAYSVGIDSSDEKFKIAFDYDGDSLTTGTKLTMSTSGQITCSSSVTATNFILSSDKTLKENIKDLDVKVDAKWRSYKFKDSEETRYGVIAQELEETNPELVKTDEEGLKSVKYIDLLIAKIAELEARLEKAGL